MLGLLLVAVFCLYEAGAKQEDAIRRLEAPQQPEAAKRQAA